MRLFDFFIKNKFKVMLPRSVRVERLGDKIKFIGTSNDISTLANEIQKLSKLPHGQLAKVDKYVFKVSDYMTEDRFKANWIELPGQGWSVLASKFLEVAGKYEESPFFFNSCGYTDKIPLDIGVEITDLDG